MRKASTGNNSVLDWSFETRQNYRQVGDHLACDTSLFIRTLGYQPAPVELRAQGIESKDLQHA